MLKVCLVGAVVCCALSGVLAAPIPWTTASGGNGHFYEFVLQPEIKWSDAKTAAQASTFSGFHGYLATVTSAGENEFLADHWPERGGGDQNGWLGGFQDTTAPDFSEPAGGWRWVTGEPWVYSNWHVPSGQPDDSGGGQNWIRSNADWQWDDFPNDPINPSRQYVSGYFVEYTVPEPGAMLLSAIGVAVIAGRRRARCITAA